MKIFVNGNFITFSENRIEAIVCDDKIYYAGIMKDALKFDGDIVDLKGKTVIPGLLDLTIEFFSTVFSKSFIDVSNAKSIKDIKRLIENKVWNQNLIICSGYDAHNFIEDNNVTAVDIDYDVPIIIIHNNKFKGIINQAFMNEFGFSDSLIEGKDLFKAIFMLREMNEKILETIPYAINLYYERGFITQTARIDTKNEEDIVNKINSENLITMETSYYEGNSNKKIIRVDTDSRKEIIYTLDVLSEMLKKYNDLNKQAFILCHSQNAVDLVKEVLEEIDCYGKRWNIMSLIYLKKEDIVFFTKKGMTISVDLEYEFVARKDKNYKPFSYFDELERNDAFYSLCTSQRINEYNIFERIRLLTKGLNNNRGIKLLEAASKNKAYSLFLENRLGRIKEGLDASFLVLNSSLDDFNDNIEVCSVYKNGRLVYINEK